MEFTAVWFEITWRIITLIILFICFRSFYSLAPWVPTNRKDLSRINKFVKLQAGEKFLEVGCGTALVAIHIAKNNPNNEIVGIEMSPLFYWISKFQAKRSGCKNIKIIKGNALKFDFSKYDVLYIFGLPGTIQHKIFPKLQSELKTGARFFSYCISMEQNIFKEIKHKENKTVYAIYEYIKEK